MASEELQSRYNIILDTEVLMVFLIGIYNENNITKYCNRYKKEDFDNLINFLSVYSKKIIVTPHILTEVSNFLENGKNFENVMNKILEEIQSMKELFTNKKIIIRDYKNCLCKFGFADTATFDILKKSKYTLLLTTDDKFKYYCHNNNVKVREFPLSC